MYLWDNFDFFGYKIHKITYSLDPIMPYLTDIGRHCSRYRYSDSSIFIFDAFQNLYCNIFTKPIWYIGLLHSTTLGSLAMSSFILLRDNSFIMYVRGHSRNQPKGGRNSPQRYTSTRCSDHFLNWHSKRVQKPLKNTFSAVFCTKLGLNHCVRLVWSHEIKFFCPTTIFAQCEGLSRDHCEP